MPKTSSFSSFLLAGGCHRRRFTPTLLLAFLGLVCSSPGQQPDPPAAPPGAASAAVPTATAAPAAKPAPAPGADAAALDYLYNKKPQEGSVAGAAAQDKMRADDKTRALDALAGADSPLEPAFEQYLNSAESDPVKLKAYLANYDRVIALLLQQIGRAHV